ncbi:uroporphyrinogen-III synthase [Cognatishimia sp. F0-27]|uniref:uroporphyrinogen-III synthase n=1 Tax=Cognatishimia sp. F0-27 TaxID=2816855 RepID=UPI001D0C3CFF|nr:uroporphyrinogen-III synthase [Cognatishimia sp. F0-27]MCC1491208.1 uroporphyrinogen-III synthase [Cognatishimia sp. F0-27]
MTQPRPILLMTRPPDQAAAFVRTVTCDAEAPDCETLYAPLFEIVPKGDLPELGQFDHLIFTSGNGVAAFADALGAVAPPAIPAWCVGDATAAAARALGLEARSAKGDADRLVKTMRDAGVTGRGLHLRGHHARGNVAGRLTAAGLPTDDVVIYDQRARPLTSEACAALDGTRPVVLPIFSPRSARLLAERTTRAPLLVVAMSDSVAKAAAALHMTEISVARRPNAQEMRALTVEMLQKATALEGPRPEV